MNIRRFCPDHGHPDDEITAWPCPIPGQNRPPDAKACNHLDRELTRRAVEVVEEGNYFDLLPVGADGVHMVQEYRGHQMYGQPQPL